MQTKSERTPSTSITYNVTSSSETDIWFSRLSHRFYAIQIRNLLSHGYNEHSPASHVEICEFATKHKFSVYVEMCTKGIIEVETIEREGIEKE